MFVTVFQCCIACSYSSPSDVAEVLKTTEGMFEEVIGKLSSETTMGMPIIIIS